MSSDAKFLCLRLQGPLQSWGFESQYNRRNTGLFPTKSAIAGMCCAALGFPRGSDDERQLLTAFRRVHMTAISIPRRRGSRELAVRRLVDYHTVQNTRRASGSLNVDCVLTSRQYLVDAGFGVVLAGDAGLLTRIGAAIADPRWGIWLGRKTCIPSAPVLAGLADSREEALRLLIGDDTIESFTRQEDVSSFVEGKDSLGDNPECFASGRRTFSPRRVAVTMAVSAQQRGSQDT